MSADNWADCPRCHKNNIEAIAAQEDKINKAYGSVPVEEFDKMREDLTKARFALEAENPTFREDYEFYGAETGVVTSSYSGQCTRCGLKLKFEEAHPIPGL